ncbi:hypothetical protein [Micromonospora zamorensis]|uniref:hypothetical protein n=1 Tax=Micromonospora zamorensis TaxID=709883 RepID=UPI002E17A1A7
MNNWEIILGILFGLVVNEVTDVSPWAARKLARWAAYRWATDPEIAAGYAEEWAALIDDRPGKLLKLLTAVRFTLGAAGRAAPRAGIRVLRAARAYRRLLIYVRVFMQNPKRVDPADRARLVEAWGADLHLNGHGADSVRLELKDWRYIKGDVKTWHHTRIALPPVDPEEKPPKRRPMPKPR